MTYRKTWFSYVLWGLYAALCALFLACAGSCASTGLFAGTGYFSARELRLFGLLLIPAAAALYGIVRWVSGRIRRQGGRKIRGWIIESIVVCAVLAAGISGRIVRAMEYIELQNAAENSLQAYVNGIEYFNMAKVTQSGSTEPLVYGGAYLYVACLSVVLSFLGNKAASAILFQVFVQVIGLVLAYAAARKMAGRLPACLALLALSCSAGCLEMLKDLGPGCLLFDLYLARLLAAGSYVRAYCANRMPGVPALAGAAAVGILIGILGFLDLTALTLLLVMTAAATGKKRRPEDGPVRNAAGMSAAVILTALFACAAGLCGAWEAMALYRGTGLRGEMISWLTLRTGHTAALGLRPLYPCSTDMFLFAGLAVLASFLVFEFFRGGREQNYTLWILLCAAAALLAVCGVQSCGLLSIYLWGVLAGLGLQNCIFGDKTRRMQTLIEEINQAAEELTVAESTAAAPAVAAGAGTEPAEEAASAATEAEPAEEAGKEAPKPRFLENPLPLPRKHVRRQMEYQYEVAEKDMKFDIEIREDDDFDL